MRKIPTVFVRDFTARPHYVTPEVTPGCEWVLAGEGVATRKYDGTCMRFDGEVWWSRRTLKGNKTPPARFILMETDEVTGHRFGWEPMTEANGWWKAFQEGLCYPQPDPPRPGTYELVGPRVNGNPERAFVHTLVMHERAEQLAEPWPRSFESIRAHVFQLRDSIGGEGIVYHHLDGRMAKIKGKDFRP